MKKRTRGSVVSRPARNRSGSARAAAGGARRSAPIAITAEEFDRKFDAGEDISAHIDWASATRPGRDTGAESPRADVRTARAYPARLDREDDTIRVSFPDFPEVHTVGRDEADALRRGRDALATILEAYIKDRRPIPAPSARRATYQIAAPARVDAKIGCCCRRCARGRSLMRR